MNQLCTLIARRRPYLKIKPYSISKTNSNVLINKRISYKYRYYSSSSNNNKNSKKENKNTKTATYALSAVILSIGLSYLSVPLYRIFCQVTGFGGTTQKTTKGSTLLDDIVKGNKLGRPLDIHFTSHVSEGMPWDFKPLQHELSLRVGQTCLAFYNAKNRSDKPIIGVATYNVTPSRAGLYFHKVQCFCFDEQRLAPYEDVDMPVFFIDPAIENDKYLKDCENITLSYTFFRVEEEDGEVEDPNALFDEVDVKKVTI